MTSFRAVLAVAALACAAPVLALDASAPHALTVNYDDLNLQSEQGAEALYSRLRAAARRVCAPLEGRELRRREAWRACFNEALSNAVTTVNVTRVTALHQRTRTERAS